jgi:hypothetical protein
MWARLRARPPRVDRRTTPDAIFVHWLALAGALLFISVVFWWRGVWWALNNADPTGITQITTVIFFAATLWCGFRAWTLMHAAQSFKEPRVGADNWSAVYLANIKVPNADRATLTDLLAEQATGAHETAWWINGLLLKLGLLGTVVGFILMAFTVANIDAFDVGQAQALLKNMTRGMGVALLTTLVGLIGNMVLGWQLLMLDRFADQLVAQIVQTGVTEAVHA